MSADNYGVVAPCGDRWGLWDLCASDDRPLAEQIAREPNDVGTREDMMYLAFSGYYEYGVTVLSDDEDLLP